MGTVNTAELRAAATMLDSASETIGANVPALSGVGTALPGSTSAGAATSLDSAWSTAFEGLGERVSASATSYRACADAWDATDQTVADSLDDDGEG
ncbi:MAG: hypothetical protein J0H73_01310 [Salana multivorans]|nr:hypothetical protein [Salana multivorans]